MKTKTKRTICEAVAGIAFFYLLFVVGGIERDRIDFAAGMIRVAVSMLICFCALYKGGCLRNRR